MKLGDKVKAITDAVGIEQCDDCKKTQNLLNRRGFIGTMAAMVAAAKIGAYQLMTGDSSLPFQSILGLTRMLNTIQGKFWIENDRFATKQEMLNILAGHEKHTDPGSQADVYMSRLDITKDEIVPGWELDFDGDNTGYILMLVQNTSEARYAIITDSQFIIYWAKTNIDHPRVKDLQRAKDLPNSGNIDDYNESHRRNLGTRLKAVAYSVPPDLCIGCPGKGCSYCIQLCCRLRCTGVFPPPSPCFFNCGGDNNCVWAFQLGGNHPPNPCQACAHNYYGVCCTCMP